MIRIATIHRLLSWCTLLLVIGSKSAAEVPGRALPADGWKPFDSRTLDRSDFPFGAGDVAEGLQARDGRRSRQLNPGSVAVTPEREVFAAFAIEFEDAASCRAFRVDGVSVFHRFGSFANVFVRVGESGIGPTLEGIRSARGYRWIEWIGEGTLPPPEEPGARLGPTRQAPEAIVRGGVGDVTGKGVLLAIIDSGVDFRHPDFITLDTEGRPVSRILYLWDTSVSGGRPRSGRVRSPVSFPDGSPVGVVYTRDELSADLRRAVPTIPATDLNGHGTTCAGIAAGNGRGDPEWRAVKGVAPDADLIVVRLGVDESQWMKNVYLLNSACAWLDSLAGARPLVISCSFGGGLHGRDGQDLQARELDAQFPRSARGRAVVVSAGNDGRQPIHVSTRIGGGPPERNEIRWRADGAWLVRVYLQEADSTEDIYGECPPGCMYSQWINPFTRQKVIEFRMAPEEPTEARQRLGRGPPRERSIYRLRLATRSGRSIEADLYVEGGGFDPELASSERLIGSPGTATNVITVGSFDWSDQYFDGESLGSVGDPCDRDTPMQIGRVSCFSSRGYTRLGQVKPDITGPGAFYYATLAHLPNGDPVEPVGASGLPTEVESDPSGRYQLMAGTSAATPYVAGCLALVLQRRPSMTLGELGDLLRDAATHDEITGPVPNTSWGHGKLDLPAVRRMLAASR